MIGNPCDGRLPSEARSNLRYGIPRDISSKNWGIEKQNYYYKTLERFEEEFNNYMKKEKKVEKKFNRMWEKCYDINAELCHEYQKVYEYNAILLDMLKH